MVPLPDPEAVTVHQLWLLTAVQLALDVTVNEIAPAAVVIFWFEGVTDKVGAAPAWDTVTVIGDSPATVTVIVATLAATVFKV